MKRFILNTFFFLLIPLVYFGVNFLINYIYISKQKSDIPEVNVLIVGDSHTMKSLKADLFNSALNISETSEPFIITFWKLDFIFDSFIPDTVILGFSYHNISKIGDLRFSDNKWASEMFKRAYPFKKFDNIKNIIEINYNSLFRTIWKQTCFYPKKKHIKFQTNHKIIKKSFNNDYKEAIQRHYFYNTTQADISQVSIGYLDSIINLCISHKIVLILVTLLFIKIIMKKSLKLF